MRQILELVRNGTFPYDDFPFRERDLKETYHQVYSRMSGYVHGNYRIETLDKCCDAVRQVVDVSSALLLARFGRSLTIEHDDWSEFLYYTEEFRLDATKKVIAHIVERT